MTPRSEAIAFRAWQVASRMEWDCTVAEVADEIEVPVLSLAPIIQAKGWAGRFRAPNRNSKEALLKIKRGIGTSYLTSENSRVMVSVNAEIHRHGSIGAGAL